MEFFICSELAGKADDQYVTALPGPQRMVHESLMMVRKFFDGAKNLKDGAKLPRHGA